MARALLELVLVGPLHDGRVGHADPRDGEKTDGRPRPGCARGGGDTGRERRGRRGRGGAACRRGGRGGRAGGGGDGGEPAPELLAELVLGVVLVQGGAPQLVGDEREEQHADGDERERDATKSPMPPPHEEPAYGRGRRWIGRHATTPRSGSPT